ncbi:MAG TPA: c-type cytochrome [Casimicrobiaceae bacterium]
MISSIVARLRNAFGLAWLGSALPLVGTLAICIGSGSVAAQQPERTGKEVVDQVCSTCHATGAHGAPRIGDKKAWSKLASRGLAGLTKSALAGIRQMPPHGGNFLLTDVEIERAVTYMVNRSGGHWTEPISTTKPVRERTGEEIVNAQCSKCHQEGVGGAPRIGDLNAWIPRLKPGLDVVVRSAINGHGGMPARGGMANLTDAELRSAIIYMFSKKDAKSEPK